MLGGDVTFFGVTRSLLVINGGDRRLERMYTDDKKSTYDSNTICQVYMSMLVQVCLDYNVLPVSDVSIITLSEIRFLYNGIRAKLRRDTKPAKSN